MPEHDHEHEFPLRAVLEREGWEAQIEQFPGVEQVDHMAPIDGIADKPVGMPGKDAVCFPFRDALEHPGEYGTAWRSCTSAFREDVNNGKALGFGKPYELTMLRFKGQRLMVVVFSGFPTLDEVLMHIIS